MVNLVQLHIQQVLISSMVNLDQLHIQQVLPSFMVSLAQQHTQQALPSSMVNLAQLILTLITVREHITQVSPTMMKLLDL